MIWSHSSVESTSVHWRTKQPDCIRQLHIAPVSDVTCNQSLVSYVNIYEPAILMSNAYIKKEHWTFFARQNRKKEKQWQLVWTSEFVLI